MGNMAGTMGMTLASYVLMWTLMMAAMMLRQNLVASRDEVAPSPNPEVQARYEAALQQLLAQPDKATEEPAKIKRGAWLS